MEWKDATSYRQGERQQKPPPEPRQWEARFGDIRISVHRVHRVDGWFLSCYQLGIDRRMLSVPTDSAEEAKQVAAVRLTEELQDRIEQYGKIVQALG